jgi:hypothetical protein
MDLNLALELIGGSRRKHMLPLEMSSMIVVKGSFQTVTQLIHDLQIQNI